MVKLVPVDEVNVQIVGVAVGTRVNVRPWASVTVRLLLPFGSATPEKAAPSSPVTVLSWTPLPVAPTKTLIMPLAGSTPRSRTLVTQRCRTGDGIEPLVAGLLPARYSARLL